MMVFGEGGKIGKSSLKNSSSKDKGQQRIQPTCDAEPGIHIWAKLVGGKPSHHCQEKFNSVVT